MLAADLWFYFDHVLWVLVSFHNIFEMLLFLPLSVPRENCILIRRYDWFFWVIQFNPLLLHPRYHIIPFMYWSNSSLQLFRDYLVPILLFGGCFRILVSFLLKYIQGLLILLCSWSNLVLELQWSFLHSVYYPKV